MSRGYQCGTQRRAWDAKAAAAATKKPVCKHSSFSTPPLPGACAALHGQAPVIQGQLSRENARRASGCCNVTTPLTPQARPASSVPLPPPAWVSQSPRSSCSFNPILYGQGTDALRRPTRRGGANPKLSPGSCANKEEKGKSHPAASGAAG